MERRLNPLKAWIGSRKKEPLMDAKELSRADLHLVLDTEIRETTGMSLAEFTAAIESGRLDPESPRVAGLAILVGARAG
jgi:hypothetical protein